MSMDWKKWAAEKGIKNWFRKDNLIVLVLAGILLVIIALPTKEGGQSPESSGDTEDIMGVSKEEGSPAQQVGQQEAEED